LRRDSKESVCDWSGCLRRAAKESISDSSEDSKKA
jgi:hypothetical protein